MAAKKLRIGMIGLGDIARKAYLPLMCSFPGVEPVLCTRDPATLRELAERYRVRETYRSVEELIASRPAAAMVHSATESHLAVASKLLSAGIPVFVDKPLSYSLSDSEKLLGLAMEKHLPLFVGFNRRYAPLVAGLKEQPEALQINWQKNRINLPGEIRNFIFDDFIHVIDGLRFLAPEGPVEDLSVHHLMDGNLLSSLQIRWRQGDCLLTGGMNRISGTTEETIEYFTPGNTWRIDDLHAGVHHQVSKPRPMTFGHWESTLHKRGFVGMLDDWVATIRHGNFDRARYDDAHATHALCEMIVERIGLLNNVKAYKPLS